MDILRIILLILHFVGLSMLFGGFLVQQKAIARGEGTVLPIMWRGALTQIVTGILLVATIQIGDLDRVTRRKLKVAKTTNGRRAKPIVMSIGMGGMAQSLPQSQRLHA